MSALPDYALDPPSDLAVCDLCDVGPLVDDLHCETCADRLDLPAGLLVAALADRDLERQIAGRMRDTLADVGSRMDVNVARDVWWLVHEWDCHMDRLAEHGEVA